MTPLLSNGRLLLRALEPSDAKVLLRYENDAELWPTSMPTGPYSLAMLRQFIADSHNDLFVDRQLRLMLESDNKVVGIIDLMNFEPLHARAEIGIVVDEAYRRRGLAREAVQMLACHCFSRLGLHQLYALVQADNQAACQLFTSVGFHRQARLGDWFRKGQQFVDADIYVLAFQE